MPWINGLATSYFGARGIKDVSEGRFAPETALELMPLTQLAKPVASGVASGMKLVGHGMRPIDMSLGSTNYAVERGLYPDFSKMTRAEKIRYLKTQRID